MSSGDEHWKLFEELEFLPEGFCFHHCRCTVWSKSSIKRKNWAKEIICALVLIILNSQRNGWSWHSNWMIQCPFTRRTSIGSLPNVTPDDVVALIKTRNIRKEGLLYYTVSYFQFRKKARYKWPIGTPARYISPLSMNMLVTKVGAWNSITKGPLVKISKD